MKTTLNDALEIAQTGNWDKAWEVAKQDEGLSGDCTFEQWKAFAIKAIARRKDEELTTDERQWVDVLAGPSLVDKASEWRHRLDSRLPIKKAEWQQFIADMTPGDPKRTVYLVEDTEGWSCHDPELRGDSTYGNVGFYRAAMMAQLEHPNATVILGS